MVAGAALGRDMTEMYTQFFRFPVFEFVLPGWVVVTTTTIGIGAATLGAISAVRRAAALPPAEAMRPEPPARYRATIVERLGLQRLLPPAARMVLRHLERRPIRALLSIIGIAMAGAVLVLGAFVHDAINELIEHQFHRTQRHDVSIALVEPRSTRAVHDIAHLPGVRAVEPYRTVAARLRRGHHERRLAILGLDSGEGLHRMLDADGEAIDLPPEGLVISEALAERLGGAVPGDELIVEALEGDRPVRIVRIERTVRDYIGLSAYMRLDALNRMMHEPTAVSGAFITADPAQVNDLYQEVKATPQAAGVTIKVAAIRSFMATLAETLLRIRAVNVIFATIIAFGVVYNSARISLSERARDLASLRVLGFTRGEISAILLGELGVLIIAAIPLGLLLGYGLAAFASVWLQTESHRMPLVVAPPTFAFAAAVVLVAGLISGLIVRRRLDHLDLVAVLKTRD
jgi:putative ABC transport system permease protein